MIVLDYQNTVNVSKNLGEKFGLNRTQTQLLESILFWALQSGDFNDTICVGSRKYNTLSKIEETGLIEIDSKFNGDFGAKLTGDFWLDLRGKRW